MSRDAITRRELLLASLGAVVAARVSAASASAPVLGLISPVEAPVPAEALALYPQGIEFRTANVGLQSLTPQGYDQVLDRIAPAARALAAQGAQAVALLGTSLSFYQGAAFNRDLTQRMSVASGLPAVTMSTAVIEGLRRVGGRRLAVATAYDDEVNARLRSFLHEEGFEVLKIQGLGIQAIGDVRNVTPESLLAFSAGVAAATPGADALLVSCGGLRTLDLIEPLERQLGLPVVSSLPHALRAGVRLLGLSGRAPGYGRLLAQ